VRSALTGALANAVSSLAHSATWTSDTALLILDFQVGIGDQPYARSGDPLEGRARRANSGRQNLYRFTSISPVSRWELVCVLAHPVRT
jgi:hypothetical protein